MRLNTPSFSEAFACVKQVSETVLAKYAKDCDAFSRFPVESFDAIKSLQLQALLVPSEYGGWGLNFYEYQQCLSYMAQYCAATASAFNMHNIVVGSISECDMSKYDEATQSRLKKRLQRLFHLIVEERKIFAAATTEPKIGARFSQVETNYTKKDNVYTLNGIKSFVTMATYADYYLVLACKAEQPEKKHSHTYFIVPRDVDGVNVRGEWDVLGMRGTASNEVHFNNVSLPFDALFMGQEGFALNKVMRQPHWITGGYLGVYLGIMTAIFQFCCSYIRQRSQLEAGTGLAFQPLIQARIGEMFTLLNNAKLNVFSAATQVVQCAEAKETHLAIYAAKYILGEAMPQIALLALRTCGGSTIHKRFPLERYLRDSCCGGLMPAVSDVCQFFLGQSVLDIPVTNIW